MAASGYTPISLYYSSTPSAVPTAGNLVNGELAINIADGILFYKDDAGVVQSFAGSGGDVVGPASSTDNAIARFDSTTGKLIQNSAATLDDTGSPTFVGSVLVSGTSTSAADLKLYEDTDNGTNYLSIKAPASLAANVTLVFPDTDGDASQVLTTDGSGNLSWATPAGGGGFSSVSAISTPTTAVKSTLYVFTASTTLTLPATPSAGDQVGVVNLSGTTTCVIGRNGNEIMNVAEDMTIDVVDAGFTLVYSGATYGWTIV